MNAPMTRTARRLAPNERQECGTPGARLRHLARTESCDPCGTDFPDTAGAGQAAAAGLVAALREYRAVAQLAQRDLAVRAGLPPHALRRLEDGWHTQALAVVCAAAAGLGLTVALAPAGVDPDVLRRLEADLERTQAELGRAHAALDALARLAEITHDDIDQARRAVAGGTPPAATAA